MRRIDTDKAQSDWLTGGLRFPLSPVAHATDFCRQSERPPLRTQFGPVPASSFAVAGHRSGIVVDMMPEEMADLVHLRRARGLIDRNYAQPLDVPAMARSSVYVDRPLLAQVPCDIRRNPLHLSHDTTNRARQGSLASGELGHRHLHRRRLHVAWLVQLTFHRSRRCGTVAVPRALDHRDLEVLPSCVSMFATRPRRTRVTV